MCLPVADPGEFVELFLVLGRLSRTAGERLMHDESMGGIEEDRVACWGRFRR
jgi:hypothetical protein